MRTSIVRAAAAFVAATSWSATGPAIDYTRRIDGATRVLPDGRVEGVCEGTTHANDMVYSAHRGAGSHTTFFGSVASAGGDVIRLLKNPGVSITPAVAGSPNSAIHARPAAK